MFGDTVLALLEEKRLTQKQFALMLKIPCTTLNGYIKNKREPDFKTLLDISALLEVSVDRLLGNPSARTEAFTESELALAERLRDLSSEQRELVEIQINTMLRQNSRR